MYVVTSDVQAVNATVVGESTIDIQCWFIHGSDAPGCKVVLVSDHPGVNYEVMNISRNDNNMSASGIFNLTQPVSCYSKVLAFDIESDDTFSNLTLEVNLYPTSTPDTLCSGIYTLFSVIIIVWMEFIIFYIVSFRFGSSSFGCTHSSSCCYHYHYFYDYHLPCNIDAAQKRYVLKSTVTVSVTVKNLGTSFVESFFSCN